MRLGSFGTGMSTLVTAITLATSPVVAQEVSREMREAMEHARAIENVVGEISQTLWTFSEIALREQRSAGYLTAMLEQEGFAVRRGVADMPTAFVAEYGAGRPIVGILAEYDALPGIGNVPVPGRAPREDGWPHGQGCGHNLFGAGSVGGAIAIKRAMDEHGVRGTLRVYGTPAEETVVGKVYMAKAGLFGDVDAALEWHPDLRTQTSNRHTQAMNSFEVEFRGQAAHAAYDPWNGRSALDAVELMNDGVNLLREHIRPSTRIHYVIPSAGEAPNVVPEFAKVWYYVRDENREFVERYYEHVLDIARGAAIATRTDHTVRLLTGVHAVLFNRPLQEAVQRNLELVGAPQFTDGEQGFAREMQAFLEIDPVGYNTAIEPLASEPLPVRGGSTDVAEVSRITPTVGFLIASAPAGVPWHSWATSASHGTTAGIKAARVAAQVIALTGMELLTDPGLVRRARHAFEEATAGNPYVSPVPPDQKPVLPATGTGGTR